MPSSLSPSLLPLSCLPLFGQSSLHTVPISPSAYLPFSLPPSFFPCFLSKNLMIKSEMSTVVRQSSLSYLSYLVSTIILGMLESSGFRKYSTLLVIQLFSRRLCLCHCLCIRLCLCICVPYSFLNSYYHKLSENVWVWGSGASRSGGGEDVTIAGRTDEQKGKIEVLSR